jgi:hypothetical protein
MTELGENLTQENIRGCVKMLGAWVLGVYITHILI